MPMWACQKLFNRRANRTKLVHVRPRLPQNLKCWEHTFSAVKIERIAALRTCLERLLERAGWVEKIRKYAQ